MVSKQNPIEEGQSSRSERVDIDLIVVVLSVALFYALLAGFKLARTDSPASFIVAGEVFTERGVAPVPDDQIGRNVGFDGQFYFRMSLSPFSTAETEHGIRFDVGAYRQQRIFYPLVVYLTSFGNAPLATWMMIFINYIGLIGIALVGALIVRHLGGSAYWGAFIAVYPGLMFAFVRDLTDIMALYWMLMGIYALLTSRMALFALFITFAALSRETTLIVAAGAGFVALTELRTARARTVYRLICCAVPVAVYMGWSVLCAYRWSGSPVSPAPQLLGVPFGNFFSFVTDTAWEMDPTRTAVQITEGFLLLVWLALAAFGLRRSSVPVFIRISFAVYSMILVCLNVWRGDVNFLRIFAPGFALATLVLAVGDEKFKALRLFVALCWIVIAISRCTRLLPIYLW